ncbi:MAG: DUF1934 domain-containing protein [Oscillospiraceae bacterium]|nr:DUF1934 domain-containing protein [Oscillospiraceae bacterium]
MKKEVLITVTGLIYTGDGDNENDYIDVITPGKYYFRNGSHVLVYEEILEGCEAPVRNFLTVSPEQVSMRKSGIVFSQMEFVPGKPTRALYGTPFGELELDIETKSIDISEGEDGIRADIRYVLTVNGIQRNNCFVKILVQPTGTQTEAGQE